MQLHEKLCLMRAQLHMSRPVLANLLGVPATSYKNWELHYRSVPADLLLRIYNHSDSRIAVYGPFLLDARQTTFPG